MAALDIFSARTRLATAALGLALATAAFAQTAESDEQQAPNSASALKLPSNPQLFGTNMPSVIKATAIVNGQVITQTDVEHRLALLAISNGGTLDAANLDQLRQQVLRNLIDETLQVQAAKAADITIPAKDIDKMVERVAANVEQKPEELAKYLQTHGSSINSIRRQVEGELAWNRLRAKIESGVSVGDDEVKAVLDKLNASKGTEEFHVGEIYLSAGGDEAKAMATANKVLDALRQGASFVGYARQFSEASTAAVGGDLGWVRPEQLPEAIAAAVKQMEPNTVSNPIRVPGGISIIAVQDRRKILTADPRNAVLSLKQVSIAFPKGTTPQQAEPVVARFAQAALDVGGCGGADKIATDFHGELVQSDQVKLKELPPALQEIMLPLQVGQATRPFGSIEEGVRILVICGRDEVDPTEPSFDQVYNQLNEERVNVRARRYLRDLRRDAVIEFR